MFTWKVDNDTKVLKKITKMREPYNTIGERLHEIIMKAAPELEPKLWYGAPAYTKDGEVLCFFRVDDKFMTFGLTEKVNFTHEDDTSDQLMASAWFFTALDPATEARISAIVRKAVS